MSTDAPGPNPSWPHWRRRVHTIIFEADTRQGKLFDVVLIALILLSVLVVLLESVPGIRDNRSVDIWLVAAEWFFTILFTIEYALRLISVTRPLRYARSFYGIVDLLAILPTYLSLLIPGGESLLVIRALRLLRIFRVFKLVRFLREGRTLVGALRASLPKVTVFIMTVLITVLLAGTLMYLIEAESGQFTSIPVSIYWAIVTVTTVGYGDIAPQTVVGRCLAATLMIIGYSLIIVPTGVLSAELVSRTRSDMTTQHCPHCSREGHDADAKYCKYCGGLL